MTSSCFTQVHKKMQRKVTNTQKL